MNFEKKQRLKEDGYLFDSELMCFVNKKDGKIFSSEWVEQHNLNTLQIAMYTPHSATVWKIYLNTDQPQEEIRIALFDKYGKTP